LHLHAIDITGSNHVQLTGDEIAAGNFQEMSWSPDGASLLYTWGEQGRVNDLYLFTPATQETVNLTESLDRFILWPRWSPDGAAILFSTLDYDIEDGNMTPVLPTTLQTLDVASGAIMDLTTDQGNHAKAVWRPRSSGAQ